MVVRRFDVFLVSLRRWRSWLSCLLSDEHNAPHHLCYNITLSQRSDCLIAEPVSGLHISRSVDNANGPHSCH